MRVFVTAEKPLSEQQLTELIEFSHIYPNEQRIFSTFRAYLQFDAVRDACQALDCLNSEEVACFEPFNHFHALPALPKTFYKLSVVVLHNWRAGTYDLYKLLCNLPHFAACYVVALRAFALFDRHECALEFKRQNADFFYYYRRIIVYMEDEYLHSVFCAISTSSIVYQILTRFECCCYERFSKLYCCFRCPEDAEAAADALLDAGVLVYRRHGRLERSCQIYNLKINTQYQQIYEILNALAPVETLRLPDFLFLDENKFHVNVVFRGAEGVQRVRTWLGVIAADLVQDGKEVVVV